MVGTAHAQVGRSCCDELRERLGLEEAARHEEVGAGHPRRVRRAPRVGVEHRHDRQDAVVDRCSATAAPVPDADRVQERRAVRVDDTLRVAGGAARVTHRRGGAFVDLGVLDSPVARRGEQLVVAEHLGAGRASSGATCRRRRRRRSARPSRSSAATRREQRAPGVVDDDDPVLGVVHDVGELLGEQADVERVEHRRRCTGMAKYASRCSWVFHMKVPTRSPDVDRRGRRSAAASRSARSATSANEARRLAVALEGDHLAVAVDRATVAEDHADGEREVLHRRLHRSCRSPRVATRSTGAYSGAASVASPA